MNRDKQLLVGTTFFKAANELMKRGFQPEMPYTPRGNNFHSGAKPEAQLAVLFGKTVNVHHSAFLTLTLTSDGKIDCFPETCHGTDAMKESGDACTAVLKLVEQCIPGSHPYLRGR